MKKLLIFAPIIIFISIILLKFDANYLIEKYPVKSNGTYLHSEDTDIYYERFGSGPTLLFLHGIGASAEVWRTTIEYLKDDFEIILVDLPGFFRSSKDTHESYGLDAQAQRMQSFMEQLDLREVTLVGSSMGGALALWLAKQNPERIKKVIGLSPATHPDLVPIKGLYKHDWLATIVEPFLNRVFFFVSLNIVFYRDDIITDQRIATSLQHKLINHQSYQIIIKSTELLQDERLPNELKGLKQPSMIMWGDHDYMVPEKYIQQLAKVLGVNYITVKNGGHHFFEDEPQIVAEAIKKFSLN